MKNSDISISLPSSGSKAGFIAGDIFCDMWRKSTPQKLHILSEPVPLEDVKNDLVIIGADDVNDMARRLFLSKYIRNFDIKYGTDDFCLLSVELESGVNVLLIAGASGRATIYAVYEFFKQCANAAYFWDGDKIDFQETIDISDLAINESPRFKYRGLRYFAHRGLHRFQAEHWNFEDWKKEIDWILKNKMNLFMLRIGQDDLFQRAFPDIVAYPPDDKANPDYDGLEKTGYDMRTTPMSLQQRGSLREKVLQYARDRGLMHPEDCGTMTHWYSRTPKQFLASEKVDFLEQNTSGYGDSTGKVWNIFNQKNWENYWKLTQTHIDEFGSPELFHTIGLAERKYGESREENLKIKKYVYHKIQNELRQRYPVAPLLLAAWDFVGHWQGDEVKELLKELDPGRTLILDYLGDAQGKFLPKHFGYMGNFPWIFGIFHAFAPESCIHGNYDELAKRMQRAADDKFCQGMVFWPELSHSDSIILEYFSSNSWKADKLDINDIIDQYCSKRHNSNIAPGLGKAFKHLAKLANDTWSVFPYGPEKSFAFYPHIRLSWSFFGDLSQNRNKDTQKSYHELYNGNCTNTQQASGIVDILMKLLKDIPVKSESLFLHRDVIDITRTAADYALRELQLRLNMELATEKPDKEKFVYLSSKRLRITKLIADLLELSEDFSIYHSFKKLQEQWGELNPAFEDALKRNQENSYCRSYTYEQVKYIFIAEFELWSEACTKIIDDPLQEAIIIKDLGNRIKIPAQEFFDTGLVDMAPSQEINFKSIELVIKNFAGALSLNP